MRAVEFISWNAGAGSDFFTGNVRVSRVFCVTDDPKFEGLVEAFDITDSVNPVTRNNTFGPGAYPLVSFNQITAVGDPRSVQFGLRLTF